MTAPKDFVLSRSVASLAVLDEPQRKELAAELTAHLRTQRGGWWSGRAATDLAVITVACMPGAAAAAKILTRSSVSIQGREAVDPVVQVARSRGITWLADLAGRLAERRATDPDLWRWQFVAGLLAAEQAAPPTTDWFVLGWLGNVQWPESQPLRSRPVVERLRADPYLDLLLPRIFEIDGAGTTMAGWASSVDGRPTFLTALAELAAEQRVDRGMLLDGSVGRLLRGDSPAALRAFVALLDQLAPTTEEVTARTADYLRLLADAPSPVATMAQKALRAAGTAELDAVLEASRAVLERPDKGLVRAQLTWLDKLARQHRPRAAEIAAVIGTATAHPAVDVRERAAALAGKHGAAPVAEVGADSFTPGDDLPPPPAPAPAPPPITDPDELAEEVAALYSARHFTALPLERVLDGTIRLSAGGHPRLAAALMPVMERHRAGMGEHSWDPLCLCGVITGVLHDAATPSRPTGHGGPVGRWAAMLAAARRVLAPGSPPADPRVPPPHRLLRARLAEIGTHLGPSRRPGGLLAAPTSANGALDPGTLLDRLAAQRPEDVWPWDLTQALLRLPAGPDEHLAARAAALRTAPGDRLAAWLRTGGLPAPQWEVTVVPRRLKRPGYDWNWESLPAVRYQVGVAWSAAAVDDPAGLFGFPARAEVPGGIDWPLLWPAALPSHRGLAAAYAMPYVAASVTGEQRGAATILPLLAESTGDAGPATSIALAHALASRHEQDRVAAVDAMLMLAASGSLDTSAVGHHLGTMSVAGIITLARTVQPLRDASAAGARLTVWRLLEAALPLLLTSAPPPRGTPDLLVLAAETATATTDHADIAGLAAAAARPGAGRLPTDARRLIAALTRPTAASPTAASPTAASPTAASPTAASPTADLRLAADPPAAGPSTADSRPAGPSTADSRVAVLAPGSGGPACGELP